MKARTIEEIREDYESIFENSNIRALSLIGIQIPIFSKRVEEDKEPYVNNAQGFRKYIEEALN